MTTTTLTGPQKAATVLAQLGVQRAAQVLKSMSESEVVMLMTEMARLPQLDADVVVAVVGELVDGVSGMVAVSQGGVGAARTLLRERLGAARAEEVIDQFVSSGDGSPLLFLHRIESVQVAAFLSEEHPQTIAVVLVHLPSDHAAEVLGQMDGDLRVDVAERIATMGRITPEVVLDIATVLERKFATLLQAGAQGRLAAGGIASLVGILTNADRASEKQILAELEAIAPDVAEKVRNQLFVFDDVVALDDRTLQLLLRNVAPKELAVALKGVDGTVREKFLHNLSERAAQDLVEEIELLGPTRLSAVEAAQMQLVKTVREMEEAGEIVLLRRDDDLVV
ncbi:MAG TPA: flagellar motor switch protein FliG [Acidimicrobiales bacterium]|nr:flagellar motor switch protein FliG [Acidimicrobiales bacterium]